jgi:hypothetical protein
MTDQIIDLTNCDREPIHIPGLIQPHGVLLVLQEPTLKVESFYYQSLPFWDSQRINLFRWLSITMVRMYLCFRYP